MSTYQWAAEHAADSGADEAERERRELTPEQEALAAVHNAEVRSEDMCGATHWIESPYFGAGTVYCNRAPGHTGEHVAASAEEGVLDSWPQ